MEWVIAGKHFCNINGNILKEWIGMKLTIILIIIKKISLYYLNVSNSKINFTKINKKMMRG